MEGSTATGAVSDRDIDYKSAILYFSDKSAISLQLRSLLEEFADVHLQDVRDLAERPPWLTGVPTLVTLPGLEVYKGSNAVERTKEWVRSRVRPMPPPSERCSRTWDVSGDWGAAPPAEPPRERTLEEIMQRRSSAQQAMEPAAAPALEEARE
jgi:hypothetical protein